MKPFEKVSAHFQILQLGQNMVKWLTFDILKISHLTLATI
jgi:hypothetical protein